MAWNKDLPSGTVALNLGDDAIRANNYAIEAAFGQEHEFTTGSTQSGYHTFLHDTEANIAATYTASGAFAFATDATGYTDPVPYFYDGTSWYHGLTEETLTIPNDWTAGQYCSTNTLTSGANIASDLEDSQMFYLDLSHNGQLDNPDNTPGASKGGAWFYVIQQAAGGPWQTTYDTDFVGAPVLSPAEDDIDVVMAVHDNAENIHLFNMTEMAGAASATRKGLVELATDAEAATGTDATRAVTPDNLGQNTSGTGDAGYVEIVGTNILIQWKNLTLSTNPQVVTLPTSFASAAFTVTGSAAIYAKGLVHVTPTSANSVTVSCDVSPAPEFHIIAIGLAS